MEKVAKDGDKRVDVKRARGKREKTYGTATQRPVRAEDTGSPTIGARSVTDSARPALLKSIRKELC